MSSLARPFTNRAVHIRIHPRPSGLGETREVLRLLSGFGEIEYFKSLKYEPLSSPATALIIYKDDEAAKECLTRSPIRFRMGRRMVDEQRSHAQRTSRGFERNNELEIQPRAPVGIPSALGAFGQMRGISTTAAAQQGFRPFIGDLDDDESDTLMPPSSSQSRKSNTSPKSLSTRQTESSSTDPEARIFQINTNPSSRPFRDCINVGPYHGTYPIDSKMFGQADMAKRVPLPGLSLLDWKAEEVPRHVLRRQRMWEHSGPTKRRPLGEIWRETHGGKEDQKSATAFQQFTWSGP